MSVIFLIIVTESHFDNDVENDAPAWLLGIPISIFMLCQILLDAKFVIETTDVKKRIFHCLDHPLKKVWVFGNIISTLIYCVLLFYWLWIVEYNQHNYTGLREDIKVLNLSLGSFIFYAIFLIERAGTYLLWLY